MTKTTEEIKRVSDYSASNYAPLPVVLEKGYGIWLTDCEGNRYMDFLSAYSAANYGHCHPKITEALVEQAQKLTLTSRAFYTDSLGKFCQELCRFTGFEKALLMNTGAEAVETALKLARKWGCEKKGIANGDQEIVVCHDNFHGRTLTIISFSTDPTAREGFGPYTPGFKVIPFGDYKALEDAISPNTCAFLFEPIQGEAGVNLPPDGYYQGIREICTKNNVLMVADEIQTGFGRTGYKFACDYEVVKPDLMCLGKALGAGVFPVSAVVASDEAMSVFQPGTHGSTFGGNPLACAVGMAVLELFEEDRLDIRSRELGQVFRRELENVSHPKFVKIRGRGLLNAIVFEEGFDAKEICISLKEEGVLAKQTHGHIVRLAPPLVITEEELRQGIDRIKKVLNI